MGSHLKNAENGNLSGYAAGREEYATQQNKHFQRAYATVLCATVNSGAKRLLANAPRTLF
jgi:hypothetical protein